MQIKAIKDKTTNLLTWLKLKHLSTPSVGEDAKQNILLVGMQNCIDS